MTKASRWCNHLQVSHELRTSYSERRCRECVGVIGRNDPYWRCCAECHPLCPACFEALGPEAKRLWAPPSPPSPPSPPPPAPKRQVRPTSPGQMQLFDLVEYETDP